MKFRINNISIGNRSIPLYISDKDNGSNYFTVLIGRNGIGKSTTISLICRIYAAIESDGVISNYKSQYSQNWRNDLLSITQTSNNHTETFVFKKNRLIQSNDDNYLLNNKYLPYKVIATSISPFDKFPVERKSYRQAYETNIIRIYRYLGSKNTIGQQSSIGQISRLLDSLFFYTRKNRNEILRLNAVFNFLKYQPIITVFYRLRMSYKKIKQVNDEFIKTKDIHSFDAISSLFRYSSNSFRDDDFYDRISHAVSRIEDFIVNLNLGKIEISIDFNSYVHSPELLEIYMDFQLLRSVGILSIDNVAFKRLGEEFDNEIVRLRNVVLVN